MLTRRTWSLFIARYDSPQTLFIVDSFSYSRAASVSSNLIGVGVNTVEQAKIILESSKLNRAQRIVGVGGCACLDIAKACAVGKDEFIGIPTILSTNCISSDHSVLSYDGNILYYRTTTPHVTVVSTKEILSSDPIRVKQWSSSGFGDFFAAIGGALDHFFLSGELFQLEDLIDFIPGVFIALDWILDEFNGYDERTITHLAKCLHSSAVAEKQGQPHLVGGEHYLYYAITTKFSSLRLNGPSHGEIVAIGTLVAAKVFAEKFSDDRLYNRLKEVFSKLELPICYENLQKRGLDRSFIVACLDDLNDRFPPSLLGFQHNKGELVEVLDSILES